MASTCRKISKDLTFLADRRSQFWKVAERGNLDRNRLLHAVALCLAGHPYYSAAWHDVPEYGDIKRLVDFFTAPDFEYWKVTPRNDLVQGNRVYALVEPGKRYVIYAAAGNRVRLNLVAGNYTARRFDPRTGEIAELTELFGGKEHEFALPDANDWRGTEHTKDRGRPFATRVRFPTSHRHKGTRCRESVRPSATFRERATTVAAREPHRGDSAT